MGWLRGLLFTSAFPGNPREVRPVPASVSCLWFHLAFPSNPRRVRSVPVSVPCLWFRLAFPSNPRGVRSVPGRFLYSLTFSCIVFIALFSSYLAFGSIWMSL